MPFAINPIRKSLPFVFLIILALSFFTIFFPGEMNDDNIGQLNEARSGVYGGHHPALMSFVWRHLLFISDGPLPIYILHTILLFTSIYNFMKAMPTLNCKWFYAVIVLFPMILQYSFFIWKDVGMTFCFLFAASILTKSMLTQQKINLTEMILMLVVLLYGAAIKFHGQYLLCIFMLWITYSLHPQIKLMKAILLTVPTYSMMFIIILIINKILVPGHTEGHSWQYVKIFDLTGISLQLNEPLYPEFVKDKSSYSFEAVKQNYDGRRVDDVVMIENSPLRIGRTPAERHLLWQYWAVTILKHPFEYLKHRFIIWQHDIVDRPYRSIKLIYKSKALPKMTRKLLHHDYAIKLIDIVIDCMRYVWWLPLSIAYLSIGVLYWNRSSAAKPLFFMNAVSLLMLTLLFFLSMAAVPRYIYVTIIMMQFTHPLAYLCLKKKCRDS